MNELETIRLKIKKLYEANPRIHLDVLMNRPKLSLKNAEAEITGVYPHIFQLKEKAEGASERHTVRYSEVLTGHIIIHELQQ